MRSFVSCLSSWASTLLMTRVTLGDLWMSSSRRTTSSPKSNLNGLNLVALDSEVLWDQMTEVSSLAHLPLGLPCNLLEMPSRIMPFALSTRPFD
jgi:uncharacterized membrane protein